jgi:GDPmannose 4,6-dehydratase
LRPAEVDSLVGDSTKARLKLGWTPRVSFRQLVKEMVAADRDAAERDRMVMKSGYKVKAQHQ